ncbi:MAG: DUF1292 domain-containing protein [Clostridia bacterium]|nr:DUF1292 domain-containing protein [Clostridia bacterium]
MADNKNFEDEDIISFLTRDGKTLSFKLLEGFPHEGNFYYVAQPLGEIAGEDDECVVFRCDGSGDDLNYTLVTDGNIMDCVIDKYNKFVTRVYGGSEDKP